MNYRMICRVLGLILLSLAALLLLPLIAGLCFRENVTNFLLTMGIAAALGGLLMLPRPRSRGLVARDGFVIVGLGWVLISLIGALPFFFSGSIPHYYDALFETASGLSTTGATVVTDIPGMPRGDLFWRLFTHWIGGMGVLVFLMAVLPMSGEHSMHIMRAEVPGPSVGKLVPRVRKTAMTLYLIYIALTVLEAVFLRLGGMSFYDALLHACATAGTGGFSTNPESIGGFHSLYIELVTAVFMLLFGINFNLYYLLLIGRWKDAAKNEELHWFLGIVACSVLGLAAGISKLYGSFAVALRHAFFNTATILSTTGFGTVDFTDWPEYCKWILLLLMFCGGCAGSTGGGIKLSRLMILGKAAVSELKQMVRPRSVERVQMDGKRVESGTVRAAFLFLTVYSFLLILFAALVSLDGFDVATCFTASLSCLSNIGPGMTKLIGPMGSFAIFSPRTKLLLTLAMLLGRLEIYPILVLLIPRTWKK
ncbi:MAG: TrkH family potassium uptake protein [Oscillospiraceae bacterium]|jgi:Trk-type K+ transport systems, membrane components|nr:TrkH family potassium uptake protein [Oscillospiraceae bacterium]